MNGTTDTQDPAATAVLEPPQTDTAELPPMEAPPAEPEQTQDQPKGWQDATASIFADQGDRYRYEMAKRNGASEQEALKVGDNGVGKWGDVTSTYKIPMVALPSDTPGLAHGRIVELQRGNGPIVRAMVGDVMPRSDRLLGKANIDLNPAAALGVGHGGGLAPVKWRFAQGLGEMGQTPSLAAAGPLPPLGTDTAGSGPDLPFEAAAPLPTEATPIGTQFLHQPQKDPYENYDAFNRWFQTLKPGKKDPNSGAVTALNPDGSVAGKVYPDRSFWFEQNGQMFRATPDGNIQAMKGAERKPSIHQDAQGRLFSIDPQTGAQKDVTPPGFALKPKIFRDTTSGLAFDISKPENPKPLNLPGNPASVDISGIKQGDWSSVPEDLRDVAKNIAAYKYPKLSGFALRSPYFQQMFKIISKVDPSFNYQQYDARQKFLTDFSGSGKMGQNRLSFNTALDHINTALDSSEQLAKTYDADQVSNWAVLRGKQVGGATALSKYEADVAEVGKELDRAFSGAAPHVGSEAELHSELVGGFGHILTAEQRKTALQEKAKLLGSRLGEMGRMYESTMQKPLDIALVSPEAERTLRRLGLNELADKYGSQGGKRTYQDPETSAHAVSPFPGSETDTGTGEREIVEDDGGNRFIVSPDGKLIPYNQ
jgi:hypothetical protein